MKNTRQTPPTLSRRKQTKRNITQQGEEFRIHQHSINMGDFQRASEKKTCDTQGHFFFQLFVALVFSLV
jgi:hypothetical protein